MSTTIITDHPAWRSRTEGYRVRLVEHDGSPWLATLNRARGHLLLQPVGAGAAEPPALSYTSAITLPPATEQTCSLLDSLVRLGTVVRLTTPSLWDALVAAILRQTVSASIARRKHTAFCSAYGQHFTTPAGELALTPSPERVLALSVEGFEAVGTKFNAWALRSAAEAYLDRGEKWAGLHGERLIAELASVPGIGPWTAAATAADATGDFSVYPHSDLAVRTWAGRAAPGLALPSAESEFAALWREWAPAPAQLHALTLFTLAYGSDLPEVDQAAHPQTSGRAPAVG
ncbi:MULTISPECIES: hypothetical protein [unclassified Streptomyces]|uniref:hypothetical protein n=1 Tax=unclassified Streptomyces TaxID=2593676 RepID=UPI0006AFB214|nr:MULTISPECIES: hypothetical protein [unclassified Streptomyces]